MKTLIIIAIFFTVSFSDTTVMIEWKKPKRQLVHYGKIGVTEELYADTRYGAEYWDDLMDQMVSITDSLGGVFGNGSESKKMVFYFHGNLAAVDKKRIYLTVYEKGYCIAFFEEISQVFVDPDVFFRNYSKDSMIPFIKSAMSSQHKYYLVRGVNFDSPEKAIKNAVTEKLNSSYLVYCSGLVAVYFLEEDTQNLFDVAMEANLFIIDELYKYGSTVHKYFPLVVSHRSELKLISRDYRDWMGGLFDGDMAITKLGDGKSMEDVLRSAKHELTHYSQSRIIKSGRPSVFLLEAGAQFNENGGAEFDTSAMLHYYNLAVVPSLRTLMTMVPVNMGSRDGIEMFYGVAEYFSHWLIKVKGEKKYIEFWKELDKTKCQDKGIVALESVYGMDINSLEDEFNEWVISVLKAKYGDRSRRVQIAAHMMKRK